MRARILPFTKSKRSRAKHPFCLSRVFRQFPELRPSEQRRVADLIAHLYRGREAQKGGA